MLSARAAWRDPALGEQHEIELQQGRLRYHDRGAGLVVVLVHGLFVNSNVWRKVVPLLGSDFRCITLDLPFGSHALPMRADADLSEHGIVTLIAEAIAALGLENVTLVGMDTGGAVCQFLVTQRPERIQRLVLCSCDYRDRFPPRIFAHLKLLPRIAPVVPLLFAPMRLRMMRRLPNVYGWLSHRQVESIVEDTWVLPGLEDGGVRADVNKVISIFNRQRLNEAADRLKEFDGPALVAWSRDDRIFPARDARRLAADFRHGRLQWIEGARTLSMEDQPALLARLIADFAREAVRAPEQPAPA